MNNAQPHPLILLYGNSIWIEGLASKLHENRGWDVTRRSGGVIRDEEEIDFIVTDLCDITVSESLPMLSALPGVMLIGVDTIANTLTVLTGRSHPAIGLDNVLDALKRAI